MLNNSESDKIPYTKLELDSIKLINLGDIHYGNIACNRSFFKEVIANIISNKDTYWVSTGDMLDINTSKGLHYDPNSMEVDSEINELTDLLKPIAHKCLGFVGSNHSARLLKLGGICIDKVVANMINVPYYGNTALINITLSSGEKLGNMAYYVSMTHGKSNGTTLGAKANSVVKLYDTLPSVDLALEGHTHTFLVSQKETNVIDRSKNKLRKQTTTLCVCGHCLDWSKSYAADNKYAPTPIGFPEISLYRELRNVDIRLITPNNIKL